MLLVTIFTVSPTVHTSAVKSQGRLCTSLGRWMHCVRMLGGSYFHFIIHPKKAKTCQLPRWFPTFCLYPLQNLRKWSNVRIIFANWVGCNHQLEKNTAAWATRQVSLAALSVREGGGSHQPAYVIHVCRKVWRKQIPSRRDDGIFRTSLDLPSPLALKAPDRSLLWGCHPWGSRPRGVKLTNKAYKALYTNLP